LTGPFPPPQVLAHLLLTARRSGRGWAAPAPRIKEVGRKPRAAPRAKMARQTGVRAGMAR
jgi:hypothetical protein